MTHFGNRVAQLTETFRSLLDAKSVLYRDWPPTDTSEIKTAHGVYHFFNMIDGKPQSLYIGKGTVSKMDGAYTSEYLSIFNHRKQIHSPDIIPVFTESQFKKRSIPCDREKFLFSGFAYQAIQMQEKWRPSKILQRQF